MSLVADVMINEGAGVQLVSLTGISASVDESQTLSVTATSTNPKLIPNPVVSYTLPNATGSLSFASLANAYGTTTITVTVTDDPTALSVSQTFIVTVNAVNYLPSLTKGDNQSVSGLLSRTVRKFPAWAMAVGFLW